MSGNDKESHNSYESTTEEAHDISKNLSLPAQAQPNAQKRVKFLLEYDTYDWKDMHWHAPANFIIYTDGTWTTYAKRVAHNKSNSRFVDYGLYLIANFRAIKDGPIIYSNKYTIVELDYNEGHDDYFEEGRDQDLLAYMDDMKWVSTIQQFAPSGNPFE